jgi:hypothetical protein
VNWLRLSVRSIPSREVTAPCARTAESSPLPLSLGEERHRCLDVSGRTGQGRLLHSIRKGRRIEGGVERLGDLVGGRAGGQAENSLRAEMADPDPSPGIGLLS